MVEGKEDPQVILFDPEQHKQYGEETMVVYSHLITKYIGIPMPESFAENQQPSQPNQQHREAVEETEPVMTQQKEKRCGLVIGCWFKQYLLTFYDVLDQSQQNIV